MNLQNIDHETASLADLWRVATDDMRAASEDFATATMATVADPICGAREIVMAQYLRGALKAERKSVAIYVGFPRMSTLKKPVGGIYRIGTAWVLEFPAPLGVITHKSFRAAFVAAIKAGLAPKRWFNCDAEVAS